MKRFICFLLAVSMMAVILSSCGEDEEKNTAGTGSAISYSLTSNPKNLDPQSTNDANSLLILRNIFDGLVRGDEFGNANPAVASSWESNDTHTKFVFRLREDARWQDGTPVTAKDFVFGWRRAVLPETNSPTRTMMYCVKNAQDIFEGNKQPSELGVTANDDHTLTVELSYPFADFPLHTTQSPFLPCNEEFFSTTKGKYGLDDDMILSNGPFCMNDKSWVHDEHVRVYHNNEYFNSDSVYPKSVYFRVRKSGTDYFELVSSGSADAAVIPPSQAKEALESELNCVKYADTTWGLAFNTGRGVLSNKNLRQAFVRSINTADYEKHIPQYCDTAYDIIPPATRLNGKLYRELAGDGYKSRFDSGEAGTSYEAALIELGRLDLPKITVLCPDDNNSKFMMQNLIQNWQDSIHTAINIQVIPISDIKTRVLTGDYQIALYPLTPSRDGPVTCLNIFRSDYYYNPSKLNDTTYDVLLEDASSFSDTETAIESIAAAEKYLNDNAVFYPMYYEYKYYLTAENVSGVTFAPFDGVADFSKAKKIS